MDTRTDCLGRVPFASLIALTITWIGMAVFCAMTFRGVNASLQQMRAAFQAEFFWLNKVQLAFICAALIMFVFAAVLTVVGAFATGSTRNRMYYGWKARLGGRLSTALCLALTYIVFLCWLAVFSIVVVLCVVYVVLSQLCGAIPSYTSSDCLDLTILSPLFNDTYTNQAWRVCGVALQQFCTLTESANSHYMVGYFASVAILLGLCHFMICLSANYAHIKDGFKYFELKEIQYVEENELNKYNCNAADIR
uniref:Neuronal membrane glycoprotein M6-b n=1 Tax=Trichuris muris TaxID=70415 RepID=A0A5S6Q7B2_TRIMR